MAEYFAHMSIPEPPQYFSVQGAQDYINETNALLNDARKNGGDTRAIMIQRQKAWNYLIISDVWATLP
jgi:hypothetical protein